MNLEEYALLAEQWMREDEAQQSRRKPAAIMQALNLPVRQRCAQLDLPVHPHRIIITRHLVFPWIMSRQDFAGLLSCLVLCLLEESFGSLGEGGVGSGGDFL